MRKNSNKITIWLDDKTYNEVKTYTETNKLYMSVFIRRAIQNLLEEIDSNKIRDPLKKLIHTQIKESMDIYMDRIIKLVIKSILSSESANYNTGELLSNIKRIDKKEVREIAYRNAIEYLKKKGDKFE
ncbi:MAG: hypothetical protein N2749_06590 [Clostridia bacterium]|nr:hypothetical protein [Clostridia bacterium]